MTYERWQEIKTRFKNITPPALIGQEDLPEGPGYREFIEAELPSGKIRLELWIRPKVLERKTLYTHRMNTAATVKYQYDDTEQTLTLRVFRWQSEQNNWQEVGLETLASAL